MVEALARIARFDGDSASACNLAELVGRGDGQGVWDRIFELTSIMAPSSPELLDQLTQEVFLWLMTTRALEAFVKEGISDEEIVARLLSTVIAETIDQRCSAYPLGLVSC